MSEVEKLAERFIEVHTLQHRPYVYFDGETIKADLADIVATLEDLGYLPPRSLEPVQKEGKQ